MTDFDASIKKLEAIQDEIAVKRKQLNSDLLMDAPEIIEFCKLFRDDKELGAKVVWIELNGVTRLKWGRVI